MSLHNEKRQTFKEILSHFDTAMLVSTGQDRHINARPMAIARRDDDDTLWFITNLKSAKMDEMALNPEVALTFQGDRRFLSISGRAAFSKEREKIDELWNDTFRAWFDGKDDPNIALICVSPITAEYWDQSGFKSLRYGFEAVKSYLTDTDIDVSNSTHGEIQFQA